MIAVNLCGYIANDSAFLDVGNVARNAETKLNEAISVSNVVRQLPLRGCFVTLADLQFCDREEPEHPDLLPTSE